MNEVALRGLQEHLDMLHPAFCNSGSPNPAKTPLPLTSSHFVGSLPQQAILVLQRY